MKDPTAQLPELVAPRTGSQPDLQTRRRACPSYHPRPTTRARYGARYAAGDDRIVEYVAAATMSVLVILGLAAGLVGLMDALALSLARAASRTDRQSTRLARRARRRSRPRLRSASVLRLRDAAALGPLSADHRTRRLR